MPSRCTSRTPAAASPTQDLDRVFDTAFRSDSARNRDHGGGGLGLPIARGLAALNGGTLGVENHEDGCRFRLMVPLDEAVANPAGEAAATPGGPGVKTAVDA